jgi:uncharacterized protein YdhG (YjbR/CyaY superfamily)
MNSCQGILTTASAEKNIKSSLTMKQFRSVDDYISSQPQEIRPTLERIRQTIKKVVPEAEEIISYGMPAFRYHGMLGYYAAFQKHYSFFFGPSVTRHFLKVLKSYETSKGTIKVPLEKPVPVRLLTAITKYAAKENLTKARQKAKGVKKKAKK